MDEEESLECPVCLERYDNAAHTPKMMPCLHTICVSCILEVISGNECQTTVEGKSSEFKEPTIPSGKRLMCPLCRENVSSDRLQTNRYILAHLRDLNRLIYQNHASLEHKGKDPSVYQHSKMTSTMHSNFHEAQQVQSDKPKLTDLCRRRLSRKQGRAPSPPSVSTTSGPPFPYGLQEDMDMSNQAASSLHSPAESLPSSSNSQYTLISFMIPETQGVSRGRSTGILKREGTHTRKLKLGATPSGTFQPFTQTTPTTPVAGYPLIYPKLPPATTLHQQSPSRHQGIMKRIGQGTPTISEEDFTSDVPYHIFHKTIAECNSIQNPSAPKDMNDMWCRTCEEPGKTECIGHDVIAILKDDEVNWIKTELRGLDKLEGRERNIDLSAAMSRASIASPPEYDDVTRTSAHNRKTQSEVPNLSRWSYAEIRDTVNTSCQPEVVMECYKELDRRHIEYQRNFKRRKLLNWFMKSNS